MPTEKVRSAARAHALTVGAAGVHTATNAPEFEKLLSAVLDAYDESLRLPHLEEVTDSAQSRFFVGLAVIELGDALERIGNILQKTVQGWYPARKWLHADALPHSLNVRQSTSAASVLSTI